MEAVYFTVVAILLTLLPPVLTGARAAAAASGSGAPNILLIVVDDQSPFDLFQFTHLDGVPENIVAEQSLQPLILRVQQAGEFLCGPRR